MTQSITHHIRPITGQHPDYSPPFWTDFGTDFFVSDDVLMRIVSFSLNSYGVMQVTARIQPITQNAPKIANGLCFVIEQSNGIWVNWEGLEVVNWYCLDDRAAYMAEFVAHRHLTHDRPHNPPAD